MVDEPGSGAIPVVPEVEGWTVLPPGAGAGIELGGWGDGAWPWGAMAAPEEPGASCAEVAMGIRAAA